MQHIYFANDSFLHRLNPLSKLLVVLPLMLLMLLTTEPWTPIAFVILSLAILFAAGGVTLPQFVRMVRPVVLMVLAFFVVYPFLIREQLVENTALLFRLGHLKLYSGGLYYGLTTGLRVLTLLMLSLLFSLTTDSSDFLRALVQQWRLPYRLGYTILAAFRFAPMLQTEMAVIQAAHRVRGINGQHGLRGGYERLRRYSVPLLSSAIRHAERAALAMEGRAFGAYGQRTYFRRMRFMVKDWAFLVAMGLISAAILWGLQAAGLLGSFAFLQIL
jgi:energy-coupling factor transport system permease protein